MSTKRQGPVWMPEGGGLVFPGGSMRPQEAGRRARHHPGPRRARQPAVAAGGGLDRGGAPGRRRTLLASVLLSWLLRLLRAGHDEEPAEGNPGSGRGLTDEGRGPRTLDTASMNI